jgi:transposase
MPMPQKTPLRPMTAEERVELERVARSHGDRAVRVARAKSLLAVADGAPFTEAARAAGRHSGCAVSHLVVRFNRESLAALNSRPGGAPPVQYGPAEKERILREFRRTPDREQDGTATWTLSTLQRALQKAPDGLPQVSTWTLFQVLHEAGYTWQESRTWCETGMVLRKRKGEVVPVTDPQAAEKRA